MKALPLVYIMSPYTLGDKSLNARFQCEVFDQMLTDKIVLPHAPLLTHFVHIIFPRSERDWIDYELAIIPRCDAGVRLDVRIGRPDFRYNQSKSAGADYEETEFARHGKPVFHSLHALYTWARQL